MRLAGTIAWPVKPGRKVEMTEAVLLKNPGQASYTFDHLAAVFPPATTTDAKGVTPPDGIAYSTNVFGFDDKVADGRRRYMLHTINACVIEFVGQTGRAPTAQELFDAWLGHGPVRAQRRFFPTRPRADEFIDRVRVHGNHRLHKPQQPVTPFHYSALRPPSMQKRPDLRPAARKFSRKCELLLRCLLRLLLLLHGCHGRDPLMRVVVGRWLLSFGARPLP